MIDISSNLFIKIRDFLDIRTNNDVLCDLRDILVCKEFRVLLVDDINRKTGAKAREFRDANIQYLTGQKEYDHTFKANAEKYLASLDLSPSTIELGKRLDRVVEINSYYPVDTNLKETAAEYLARYKETYFYKSENDKQVLLDIITKLESAVFKPWRILDNNCDSRLRELKDNLPERFLYLHKTVYQYVGADQEAEYLLENLINLKNHLDLNDR